jgi:hypothetical protein
MNASTWANAFEFAVLLAASVPEMTKRKQAFYLIAF